MDERETLQRYLDTARDALLWKLDGVDELDARRPLTATGTNLLGLVQHCAWVEAGYLGEVFGRPFPGSAPFPEAGGETEDLLVPGDVTRADVLDYADRVRRHADRTAADLALDAIGSVPWWPEGMRSPDLRRVLVHVIAERNRHAGHADILREQLDGSVGHRAEVSNLPQGEGWSWEAYRDRVDRAAHDAAERVGRSAGR